MTNNGFRTDRRRWLQTGAALATLGVADVVAYRK